MYNAGAPHEEDHRAECRETTRTASSRAEEKEVPWHWVWYLRAIRNATFSQKSRLGPADHCESFDYLEVSA